METMSKRLSQEYTEYQQKFNSPPVSKRFDTTNYDQEKFKELAKDPRANKEAFHKTTVDEARAALQLEMEGIVDNPQRIEKPICKELYIYRYPFHLPETFLNYRDNFELKVKFILLKSFCKISVQKEFPTEEFLGRVSVSTSKSAKIKNCIVRVLHELKDLKIIEPEFEILTKQNRFKEVSTLTSNLVSRSKSIFYTENIHN